MLPLSFTHHGAVDGVTGSCHQLTLPGGDAVLVDCGLFQGAAHDVKRGWSVEPDFE